MTRNQLPNRYLSLCLAAGLLVASVLPVRALAAEEAQTCSDPTLIVHAPRHDLGVDICDAAIRIRAALTDCGLHQTRPLTIEVVDDLSHRIGNCLAWFDCDHDTIRLTDPSRYPDVIEADSPYAALPGDVLPENALTHELAHALVTQSASDREVALVDHEYIAAALELELMAPQWRDILVSAAPVSLPPKTGLVDIWIYGLAPRKFATNAWQHFQLPENGCSLVRAIIAGEKTLSDLRR